MKQNIFRWLVELPLLLLGMMTMDFGELGVMIASAIAVLEFYLFATSRVSKRSGWDRFNSVLRKPWVPVLLFLICCGVKTLMTRPVR